MHVQYRYSGIISMLVQLLSTVSLSGSLFSRVQDREANTCARKALVVFVCSHDLINCLWLMTEDYFASTLSIRVWLSDAFIPRTTCKHNKSPGDVLPACGPACPSGHARRILGVVRPLEQPAHYQPGDNLDWQGIRARHSMLQTRSGCRGALPL